MTVYEELQQQFDAIIRGEWTQSSPDTRADDYKYALNDGSMGGEQTNLFACLVERAGLDLDENETWQSGLTNTAIRYVYGALVELGWVDKLMGVVGDVDHPDYTKTWRLWSERNNTPVRCVEIVTLINDQLFDSAGDALAVLEQAMMFAKEFPPINEPAEELISNG